jgi:hypothetical protein
MLLSGHEPNDKDRTRHDVAIASDGIAGPDEQVLVSGPLSRRFLAVRGGGILMTIVIGAAVFGLSRFASHVTRHAQGEESTGGAQFLVVARSEVVRIWLPKSLVELAKCHAQFPCFRTREELRRFLELRHQQAIWCAMTIRAYQPDGTFYDTTYIRRPYFDKDDSQFQRFLDILATAAGNPPFYRDDPTLSFLKASDYIIINDEFRSRAS